MPSDFDIVVIGGGMVGACTAALLASDPVLGSLRVALIEAQPPSMPHDDQVDLRVSAISRASERILDSFQAWSSISPQHRCAYDEMIVWDAAGKPRGPASIHFSAAASSEPNLGHIVENRRVQFAIFDSAPFRRVVTLLQGELTALQLHSDRAEFALADGRRYSALLAIGSDGAASASRKLAGLEVSEAEYEQAAFVTHVRTEHPHGRAAWQRFLPGGPIAFLPLADGRSSIVWTTTHDRARRLLDEADTRLAAELREAIDGALGDVSIAGPKGSFALRRMHARSYCAERFVLVGDAAHIVHPLAGQGVNLGLLDAAALVETLAAEMQAGNSVAALAERRVLRRYERWRKSENALALGFIDGLNSLFGSSSPAVESLRKWGLGAVEGAAPLKNFLMSRAMGTGGELPRLARPR